MEKILEKILAGLRVYCSPDEERIQRAYALAKKYHTGQTRHSGDPYISHPLAVAELLLPLRADEDAIIAALLHDAIEDTKLTFFDIKSEFGAEVAHLVDGLTKISAKELSIAKQEGRIKSLRKMFEVMGSDIRTILIKLCDRLHNMRTLGAFTPEKQTRIAQETLEIYVPITEKLNLDILRGELLLECYKILSPDVLSAFLKTQKQNSFPAKKIGEKVSEALQTAPEIPEFQLEVIPKTHVISPEEKPEDVTELEIADTQLFRILVPQTQMCYQVLFVLHQVYRGQPNAFRDHITTPKANGYQALHTRIIDDAGNLLQVQILTPEMAQIAGLGVAFYWNGEKTALQYENLKKLPLQITWLENLAQFSQESEQAHEELLEYLQRDFLRKRIFVFAESGQVFDVPIEATVLDFLYTAYPEKAGFISEVWVNKQDASLQQLLQDGDKVEFEVQSTFHPEVSWLDFVRTYTAKRFIQFDLLKYSPVQQAARGEILIQKEFDTHNRGLLTRFSQRKWTQIYRYFQCASMAELFQAVGSGKIRAEEVFAVFFQQKKDVSALPYSFTVQSDQSVNLLRHILTVAEKSKINVLRMTTRSTSEQTQVVVEVTGTAQGTAENFLQFLKNDPEIKVVRTKLPFSNKILLGALWSAVFIIFGIYFLVRDYFEAYQLNAVGALRSVVAYLPLIFLLMVSSVSVRSMRNHLQMMRREGAYMLVSILFNLISIAMVVCLELYMQIHLDIPILFVIFLMSILINSYQYAKDSALFFETEDTFLELEVPTPIVHRKDEKNFGYLLRLVAVFIFGTSPLVVKYFLTRINGVFVPSFSFVLAAGIILPFALAQYFFKKSKRNLEMNPYDLSFFTAVLFDGLMVMVYFLSVQYTLASNSVLFLNFAPVVALVFMLLFFRKKVPYLRNKIDTMRIILFFLLGCIGSSLLVINKIPITFVNSSEKFFGDGLAILIVLFDVIGTMATIHYAKKKNAFRGFDFIMRKIFFLALIFSPFVFPKLFSLYFTPKEWMGFFYLSACYVILGYWCAYEAFRRVDGLIAYLLVNLAPLVTISLEVLFFDLPLSLNLIIGAVMILGASLAAEYINSKHDKKTSLNLSPTP